jgi:hypothetical protein
VPVLGNLFHPGPNVIKLFTAVIYEFSSSARVFVFDKSFQPSLMFVGKAGANHRVEQYKCTHLGRLLAFLTNIGLGWKGL